MSFRRIHSPTLALAPMVALAVYGVLGVFGHSLHGLLPCSDSACVTAHSETSHCGCDCGRQEPAAAFAQGPATSAELRGAGHNAGDCSLCTLLAKIKVGRVALFSSDLQVGEVRYEVVASHLALPADLVLSGSPRGPPRA